MKKTLLALSTAVLLVLTGCGGGGEDEQAASDAIAEGMQQSGAEGEGGGETQITDEEAACLGDGIVEGIGVEQLREYGIIDEENALVENPNNQELSTGDAESMVDTLFECTDVMNQLVSGIEESSPEAAECVEENVDEEAFKESYVALFSGDQEGGQEIQAQITECITGSEGQPSEEPSESPSEEPSESPDE